MVDYKFVTTSMGGCFDAYYKTSKGYLKHHKKHLCCLLGADPTVAHNWFLQDEKTKEYIHNILPHSR